jgi:divalent metal cation (Fe/Co/Zn/Cd) transporter
VALFITKEAWLITKTAFSPLLDHSLSEEDQEEVYNMLDVFKDKNDITGYKKIRSRKSGHQKFIDIVIIVSDDISIIEAHAVSDRIEFEIEEILHDTIITVHVEPMQSQEVISEDCSTAEN